MQRVFVRGMVLALASAVFVAAPTAVTAASTSALQQQIAANNAQVAKLNQEIATYQAKLKVIGANKKTLQQAIAALDLQRKEVEARIYATQHTINSTQLRIEEINTHITQTSQAVQTGNLALGTDMRDLQQVDDQPLIMRVLSSENLSTFWQDVDALAQIEKAIQKNVQSLQAEQADLTASQQAAQGQQNALVQQRSSLKTQNSSLVQTKQTKTQLLKETNSQESTYQQLLAQAQAELASFSAFSQNAGGSGILGSQTKCDAWGCYYNQRDSAWGNDALNGTRYTLKSDGCLVTALAMVMTHYGYRNVTPVTINSNPGNFAAYFPAYLLMTIHVDGKTVSRVRTLIDRTLATGNPVIVGLHAYGGTHFVVLVSGSNGDYTMRDPYVPNGDNISFSSHYRMNEIYSIEKVKIS